MNKIIKSYKNIEIIGTIPYVNHVLKALKLLSRKAPVKFKTVKKYIRRIEENPQSRICHLNNMPIVFMAKKSAFYSITWCASCIAHEAYHSKQFIDYWRKYKKVPSNVHYGRKAELECMAYQILVSKQIHAPKHEIEHLKKQDGMHYKLKQTW